VRPGLAFEAFLAHISAMQPTLSPEDYPAITALLRKTIAADRFQLSRRVLGWRTILDKLEPFRLKPAPLPPPKRWVNSSIEQKRRR
jgi:hypothetical protein